MAALTQGMPRGWGEVELTNYKLRRGVSVWRGAALHAPGDGYASPLIAGDMIRFAGFATADAAGGEAHGDTAVDVYKSGLVRLTVAGASRASINQDVFALSDNDFTMNSANNAVNIGVVADHIKGELVHVHFNALVEEEASMESDTHLPNCTNARIYRNRTVILHRWDGGVPGSTYSVGIQYPGRTFFQGAIERANTWRPYSLLRNPSVGDVYDFRVKEASRPGDDRLPSEEWLETQYTLAAQSKLATPDSPILTTPSPGVIRATGTPVPGAGGYRWSIREDPSQGTTYRYTFDLNTEFTGLTSGTRYRVNRRADHVRGYYDSQLSSSWANASFITAT